MGMNLLNWIFYALTVYKAYYIVYSFMHMEGEKSLRYAVVLPVIFFNYVFTIHSFD
jgi:cytochrome c oxidase subunit IV